MQQPIPISQVPVFDAMPILSGPLGSAFVGSTLERDFSLDPAVRKLQMTKVSYPKGNLPQEPLSP
jgi:hypothetical protein